MSGVSPEAEARSTRSVLNRVPFFVAHMQWPPFAPAVAAVVIVTFYGMAILAPWVAPYDPRAQDLMGALLPPAVMDGGTWAHPLGTDTLGRDELTRLIWGSRITAIVITTALVATVVIGTTAGLVAGYFGGLADTLLMRIVDIQMSIPSLMLAIGLAAVLEPGVRNIFLVLVVQSWASFARMVRGDVLSQKTRDYVLAARAIGSSRARIMFRHLLPNVANTVLVLTTLDVGRFIVFEAGLSFLGLGVQEPSPAWGSMLASARTVIVDAWWLAVLAGLSIMTVSLASNVLGDYLTDRLDPRQRGRRRMGRRDAEWKIV